MNLIQPQRIKKSVYQIMKKKKIMAELCPTIDELRAERNDIAKENLRLESGLADLQRKINELTDANVKLSVSRGSRISLESQQLIKSLAHYVMENSVYNSDENLYNVNAVSIPVNTFESLKKIINKINKL